MKSKIDDIRNNIFQSKIYRVMESIVLTLLFALMIESIADYDNVLYQTLRYQQAARGLMALAFIIFIFRRVKLINWQSLLCTIVFIPIIRWQISIWVESPEIAGILKYEMTCQWVVLMILIDIFIEKDFASFKNINKKMMFFYILLTAAMLFHNNGRNEPMYLVVPMGLLFVIGMDKEKWDRFVKLMLNGFVIYIVYALVKSVIKNPVASGRYYGYFINIGSFGMFLASAFVVMLIVTRMSREKYGRKSVFYITSCIGLLATLFFVWINAARAMYAGILFACIIMLLFCRADVSKKAVLKRIAIILGIIAAVTTAYILFAMNTHIIYNWKIVRNYRRAGIFSPIFNMLYRLRYLMKEVDRTNLKTIIISGIDLLSSGRITIMKAYSQYFNFTGNSVSGVVVGDYFAYTAHNNYVQYLAEYGYGTFVLYFSFVISSLIISVKRYLQNGKKTLDLLTMLWIPMCLGIWLGEACSLNFPATFVLFLLLIRMISDNETKTSEE